ncbi:NAD-dependent epimerase/dehydratase family protein [Candidatus Roizmanbacteria bacterium]|nr:NAD-dependent epimerase/dehydratase family protein [Candidatus Roizmanbacteria bacterium]
MNLRNKRILITGASFIGHHLIESLIKKSVRSIRVVNLSNKHKEKILSLSQDIEFLAKDLRNIDHATQSLKNIDIVFHLAADHGGRGYVALKQGNTASNFLLDGSVFKACLINKVEKIFFASSGCVYPNFLQNNPTTKLFLKETEVKPPYDADNLYGWAKLMGELTLRQYYKDFGLKSAVARFFTVYGPYASESHAVMASIAKAYVKQDPYKIWGNGKQIRNWTYVEDIVKGILLAVEKIDDATPVNLGTQERTKVIDMVNLINKSMGYKPKKIVFTAMPSGPKNRVANISLAKKILGWVPKYTLKQGVKKTVAWYIQNKDPKKIRQNLDKLLMHE